MELIKRKDRALKAALVLRTFRSMGGTVKNLGTFMKWMELSNGGRLSAKIMIYELKGGASDKTMYLLEDPLGYVLAPLQENKKEVMDWLRDHNYKTEHKFYIEDCGMTEELWKAWNTGEEKDE